MLDFAAVRDDEADDGVDDAQEAELFSPGKKRRMASVAQKDEGPACQSCRRKKAKCSRRQPCSFCAKHDIDCVYDDTRSRPGMRSGAIEHLNQRISTLEQMFLGQGVLWQQVASCLESAAGAAGRKDPTDHSHHNNGSNWGIPRDMLHASENLHDYTAKLRTTLLALGDGAGAAGDGRGSGDANDAQNPPSKRQKKTNGFNANSNANAHASTSTADTESFNGIPAAPTPSMDLPEDLQAALVDIYFQRLHPWIPMLHELQFRQKLAIPAQRPRLVNILYAITSLCIRFSDDARLGANWAARAQLAKMCRDTVILQSMQSFSVENLQALIICAFDTISSGQSPSAWSIIGSMTRTVEQLQLSVEDEDQQHAASAPSASSRANALIRRIAFLPPARDWVELEERRRVFWNVFLMDRFCSIATGWNLSLTSADVKRRLPCEGCFWEEGRIEVPTPYFGVSEPPPPPPSNPGADASPADKNNDQTSLGAFAYCIEATESLSLVTSFFLQQALDVTDSQSVQLWLLRFKQLDLRLVRWKLFLPERWRDANSRNADNNIDPNLVVAHMTHNTAVVLLHQGIAYPSSEWLSVLPAAIRLPSPSSAETCLAAATEVAAIAAHVLRETSLLTSPQIAFCLFICGRMVLAHSLYYRLPLPAVFDSMTDSLWEISRRWRGADSRDNSSNNSSSSTVDNRTADSRANGAADDAAAGGSGSGHENLASKFASRLVHAKQKGSLLDIRQAAYSEDNEPMAESAAAAAAAAAASTTSPYGVVFPGSLPPVSSSHQPLPYGSGSNRGAGIYPPGTGLGESPDSMSLAFPPLPLAFQGTPMNNATGHVNENITPGYDGMQHGAVYGNGANGLDMLEDLNSFLDYSFLPDQRVSIYTLPPNV
ncbi:hypothetical protein SCUCBS95973_001364 [Sporothrix curviconia]|uniref:Zn(2)-C6 fungal-type domain-containing protein n=1 Tax=Sporothrix curviconia TaxID=1260050 RepID=A0ABP0AY54_9PEZI